MKKGDDAKGGRELTADMPEDHTLTVNTVEADSTEHDPRIVELVRFLARAAAEKDYANLLEKMRRKPGREKETIQ